MFQVFRWICVFLGLALVKAVPAMAQGRSQQVDVYQTTAGRGSDAAAQTVPLSNQTLAPTAGPGFPELSSREGTTAHYASDTNGAAGPTQYVQWAPAAAAHRKSSKGKSGASAASRRCCQPNVFSRTCQHSYGQTQRAHFWTIVTSVTSCSNDRCYFIQGFQLSDLARLALLTRVIPGTFERRQNLVQLHKS